MDSNNIVRHFHQSAQRVPDRIAIADKKNQITFAQLEQSVFRQVAIYQKIGLVSGNRVLVFIPMSIDLYIHILALFHMGCTAVFLDEWSNLGRLKTACEIAKCEAFVGIPLAKFFGFFIGPIRKIPIWVPNNSSRNTDFLRQKEKIPFVQPKQIDASCETALITFTTGSTQIPKAAKRTHAFLDAQFSVLQKTIKTAEDTIDMPVLPIVLLINLGEGITSVVAHWKSNKPHKLQPQVIAKQWSDFGVNRIISSPFFMDQMAKYCISNPQYGRQIKRVFTGGAPVFPSSARLWLQAFPGAQSTIVYGSTEAEPISEIDAYQLSGKNPKIEIGLCVGQIVDEAEVAIIPISDQPIELDNEIELNHLRLPQGEVGEIIVRGNHVLREYFNNPEALKYNKIFYQNVCWHRTGDAGFIDNKGQLFLTGRTSLIFEHHNSPVYPFIQEYLIQQIPGVIIGTLLKSLNEVVYFIETESHAHLESIQAELEAMIPKPSKIHWCKIPRDKRHNTKIDYQKLKFDFKGDWSQFGTQFKLR